MPQIGDKAKGEDIGRTHNRTIRSQKFIWHACQKCGQERWVFFKKGKALSSLCQACGRRAGHSPEIHAKISETLKNRHLIMDKSHSWKGGKRHTVDGYIIIRLAPGDFFYSMTNQIGLVREHRLVMAKHLSRCLLPWEIVHHRNGVRDDNKLENLELIKGHVYHLPYTQLTRENNKLRKRISELEKQLEQIHS